MALSDTTVKQFLTHCLQNEGDKTWVKRPAKCLHLDLQFYNAMLVKSVRLRIDVLKMDFLNVINFQWQCIYGRCEKILFVATYRLPH